MKRRDFLKLLTVVPLAPSVLTVMPKEPVSTKTNPFGWNPETGIVNIWPSLNGYTYVRFTFHSENDPPATCELFSSIDGDCCKKIDNCIITRQGVGMYEITIPEGVL